MMIDTQRLLLREMGPSDLPALRKILQDAEVMYAYEHAFDEDEVRAWYDKQRRNYREDGFGLWAVVLKETGEMIGDCGLTWQDCGGDRVLEIGYHLQKAHWHRGYAIEAAAACKRWAFDTLSADEVFSIIRENNVPSQNVAKRNGMEVRKTFIKHYYGMDMPHLAFSIKREKGK